MAMDGYGDKKQKYGTRIWWTMISGMYIIDLYVTNVNMYMEYLQHSKTAGFGIAWNGFWLRGIANFSGFPGFRLAVTRVGM